MVFKDAMLLCGVEGYKAAPHCRSMSRCSVLLEDATLPRCSVVLKKVTLLAVLNDARLLRGVEESHGASWC